MATFADDHRPKRLKATFSSARPLQHRFRVFLSPHRFTRWTRRFGLGALASRIDGQPRSSSFPLARDGPADALAVIG